MMMNEDGIPVHYMSQKKIYEMEGWLDVGSQPDICDIADALGFSLNDIMYIEEEKHYFQYLLNIWQERDGNHATLQKLKDIIENEFGQLRIVELIDESIREIQETGYEETLATDEADEQLNNEIIVETDNTSEENIDMLSTDNDNTPKSLEDLVYIVYYKENDQHVDQVLDFVYELRCNGINAQLDLCKPFHRADNLAEIIMNIDMATNVLLVCSESIKKVEDLTGKKKVFIKSDKMKEMKFRMDHMMSDFFNHKNSFTKYIPILLQKCKHKHVPKFLSTSTVYEIPKHLDDLYRRFYKFEKYQYPDEDINAPKRELKLKVIGNSQNDSRKTKKKK